MQNSKEQARNKILEISRNLIAKMGFDVQVDCADSDSSFEIVTISTADHSSFLIGKRGANLDALEHIIKIIANKQEDLKISFLMDINDYRKSHTNHLLDLARQAAQRVIATAKPEALDPMSSYERRLVHMELASFQELGTESIGEDSKRRIVIKPASKIN